MLSRVALSPWMRRPVVVAAFAAVALAALLSGGLVVARAVDGAPVADSTASASPSNGSNGDNNVAAGVNTTDGKTVYAIRLKIVQVTGETVDATNAAVAVNSGCTDCSTVAIAFEGVVVVGSPDSFTPTNLALALNSDCSGCTAFADAYQQVVQTSTRVRITKQGRQEIARIRKDLNDLRHSDLTLQQIRDRVAADENAFAAVLRNEIVPVGRVTAPAPADGADVSDAPEANAEPSSAASAPAESPTQSASPDASTTPDATPEPSASAASGAPSESAAAEPSASATPNG